MRRQLTSPSSCLASVAQPEEGLPLILVGAGKTLQLRNVTVHGAASLPACLHLGAGESYSSVRAVPAVQQL